MKKLFFVFFASFFILLLFSGVVYASACPGYDTSLVPCGQDPTCPCEISDFFEMILRVYNFLVWVIALPLAGLLIVVGGILLLVSGGNPGRIETSKKMLWGAAIGVFLIFGSWVIIDFILKAIGYTSSWNVLPF